RLVQGRQRPEPDPSAAAGLTPHPIIAGEPRHSRGSPCFPGGPIPLFRDCARWRARVRLPPTKRTMMSSELRYFLVIALLAVTASAQGQVRVGIKAGANYATGSQKIQPDPKDPPTNPKGLGMQFGGYLEV